MARGFFMGHRLAWGAPALHNCEVRTTLPRHCRGRSATLRWPQAVAISLASAPRKETAASDAGPVREAGAQEWCMS